MTKMNHFLFTLLAVAISISTFTACNNDYDNNEPVQPQLPEAQITEIVENAEMHFYEDEVLEVGLIATKPVVRIAITYPSVAPDGTPATLSGAILMSPNMYNGIKKARGIIMFSHYTIFRADEAPSKGNVWVEKWFLGNEYTEDFIAVSSDLYGFGATEQYAQNYLHTESIGRQNIDCLRAAKTILDELEKPYGDLLFNIGHSSGGHGTMATQMYVDTHCRGEIKINKTYVSGGAYDLRSLFEVSAKVDYSRYVFAIPLLIIGYNENSNLGVPYENIFKSPLLDNYKEWIVSKKYGSFAIWQFLNTNYLSDLLVDEMFDENNVDRKKVLAEFDKNTLTSGWAPDKDDNILIVHAMDDTYVAVESALTMHQFLKDQGVANVEGIFLETGEHSAGMVAMIQRAVMELAFWR